MYHLTKFALPALVLSSSLTLAADPAQAANRTYIVTDFDSVRLEAPIAVAIQTRRGVTARGEGDADLLERIDLNVQSRVLVIRLKRSPFEERPGSNEGAARLFLTVPALRRAQLSGAGTLAVEGLSGQHVEALAAGGGSLSVGAIDADVLTAGQVGAGVLKLGGGAKSVSLQLSGSGSIEAQALTSMDLDVTAEGAGSVRALATRAAKIVAVGPSTVTVDGHPACTVRHAGSGPVDCGGQGY